MDQLVLKNDTDIKVLYDIPVKLDFSRLLMRLRFQDLPASIERVEDKAVRLIEKSGQIVKPEAIYKVSTVTHKSDGSLAIDGVCFNNPLLRVNLRQVDRVYPFIVTIGKDLDSLQPQAGDRVEGYCLDIIKAMALDEAVDYLKNYLIRRYHLDLVWSLSPGEYQAWPASDRKPLYSLLTRSPDLIGVKLGDDNELGPRFSSLGILYSTEMEFESCQLCAKEPCMMRRAPYSLELARKYVQNGLEGCASGRIIRSGKPVSIKQ